MLGYSRIDLAVSACVHFVYSNEVDDYDDLREVVARIKEKGIVCAYLDYDSARRGSEHLGDFIARALKLDNPPYATAVNPWVPFLDDLITLSDRVNGMVLIIDNADDLLMRDRRSLFNLVESFLMQFHHWFNKGKPCHLCFQLERNELVRRVFAEAPS